MQKLIRNAELVSDDPWVLVEKDCDSLAAAGEAGSSLILPLQLWLDNADSVRGNASIAVWLDSDDDPAALAAELEQLALIAVNFPAFSDGRGYSIARQLRGNYGYSGELRAIGDVLRDQMQFYLRCGFDSFALRADSDVESAIEGLSDFSVFYQDAADNYLPPFARR